MSIASPTAGLRANPAGLGGADPAITGATGFLSDLSIDFNVGVATMNTDLKAALAALKLNPSDPQLLADYQSKLSEYTLYRNAQSSVVKAYKDVGAAIISNYR